MARKSTKTTAATATATATATDNTDAAGTVTVGCRLPAGLTIDVPGYGTLHFKGTNDKRALAIPDEYGYHGITSGVPADAWAAILAHPHHSKAKWLTEGVVFAVTKSKDAVREAQNRGAVDVGFSPMDPDNLPVAGFTTETENV